MSGWSRVPAPDPAVIRRRLELLAGLPPSGPAPDRSAVVPDPPADEDAPAHMQPGGVGRALVIVAVAAVLIAGWLTWRAQGGDVTGSVLQAGAPLLGSGPSASAPGSAAQVIVQVLGPVRRPGVVRLPAGARVADAVLAAGGLRPGTSAGMLNLARRVVDGEQIVVGAAAPSTAGPSTAGSSNPGTASTVRLDLNSADATSLDTLPGVGPVTAQRILDWRTSHGGRFSSVEQLREVDGIGQATYNRLAPLVSVDGRS